MIVVQNNWQTFKDKFEQAYMRYYTHKKAADAAHGYGASENHAHETDNQMMTVDALQALVSIKMKEKVAMENLTIINLALYQRLNQAQEEMLLLSKQMQTLQAQMNSKKPATEKTATEKKKSINKSNNYCWNHVRTRNHDHTSPTCNHLKEGHQVWRTLENLMGGSEKYRK